MEATFVKDLDGFAGTAKLWKLSEPFMYDPYGDDKPTCSFIITSAVVAMFSGPETYVFPSDENGKITSYSEIAGSFRGKLDHDEAIAGFLAVVNSEVSS